MMYSFLDLGKLGCKPGQGPLNCITSGANAVDAIARITTTIIGFITLVGTVYFIFQFIIGAIEWISASGDKSRLTKAQDRITHALTGIIILVSAYAVVALIGTLLGFDPFLTNPIEIIKLLKP